MRLREVRVEGNRLLEALERGKDGTAPPELQDAPLEEELVGLEVPGPDSGQVTAPGIGEGDPEPGCDRVRDLVLDGEHIGELAIVALRPEMVSVGRVDELRCYPQAVAGLADAAFQDRVHPEPLRHRAQILLGALEREAGSACRDAQALELGQRIDDLLGDAVAEELVLRIAAHVREGQHRDGLVDGHGRARRRRDKRRAERRQVGKAILGLARHGALDGRFDRGGDAGAPRGDPGRMLGESLQASTAYPEFPWNGSSPVIISKRTQARLY